MHDIRYLREHADELKQALARKGFQADVEIALDLDRRRRELVAKVDELKAQLNKASKAIGEAKRAGGDAAEEMAEAKRLKEEIAGVDEEIPRIEQELRQLLLSWPAPPEPEVPEGLTEVDNVPVREVKLHNEREFDLRDHLDLAESLGLLDMPRGAKITGSGWPVYTGKGAALERALINFMLDVQTREHGYRELMVPLAVNRDSVTGTGQLPKLEKDMYRIDQEDFFLIPTSEVPITNMHRDEILEKDELPLRYSAFSQCFRREAGAYGSETRGLLRVHQFNKVELVQIVEPETSGDAHEQILGHAEEILKRLGITYRVVELCAGELSFAAAKCYDIEVYSPATGNWLEASSVSNFRDFQARRMNLRYRPEKGAKPALPHTLNGSGLATSRLMVALMETWQTEDGGLEIPEVLRPYMGSVERIDGVAS